MRGIRSALVSGIIALTLWGVGCSSGDEPLNSETTTAKTTKAQISQAQSSHGQGSQHKNAQVKRHPVSGEPLSADQTFTYWALDEHSSFDPQIMEDVSGSAHARQLFEGLLNHDVQGNLVPGVAKRYDSNDDNTVYTFYLRENARWSNGDPVTAHDFVYAWQRAVNPKTASPYASYLESMNIKNGAQIIKGEKSVDALGVRAIDDFTFEVTLSASLPYFPKMLVHATVFPVHRATVEAHGKAWTKPENMVSNGAYKLTKHVVNERVEMVRNALYWNNDATIIEKVVSIIVPDANQGLIRWKAGEFDLGPVPTGQFKSLKAQYPKQAVSLPNLCNYYYIFNLSESGPAAFKDERVRKALSYAVDRSVITENILQAGQEMAFTFTPSNIAGFTRPSPAYAQWSQAERDAQAKSLLAEAGYTEGNPLSFNILYNTSEGHKLIATALTQMWKSKLNVQVTMNNMEWKTFLNERAQHNFELARGGWCGDYNEASTFLALMRSDSAYNDGKYANTDVDRLLAEAKTSEDPSAQYVKIEKIVSEDMPVIPIYFASTVFMLNDQVKGWPYENIEQSWYARELYKVKQTQ